MRKALAEALDQLDAYPLAVHEAIMMARSDEDMIDVIGTIKSNERRYRDDVRGAIAEHGPDADSAIQGKRHRAEVGRQAIRSYNTPNLMRKFQAEGITFMDLIEHGVIEVKWRWTELDNFTHRRGITINKVGHEVSTLGKEDADVGEVWGPTYPKWT